jgi:hypothetical protein
LGPFDSLFLKQSPEALRALFFSLAGKDSRNAFTKQRFLMNTKFLAIIICLVLFAFSGYSQDEVSEEITTADDYGHYLENVSDSVQYLKDLWSNDLSKINDNDHDYGRLRKSNNMLLKFIKDKRHDIKNLGAIGIKGDALKAGYVQYLNAEVDLVTQYFLPFEALGTKSSDEDYNALNEKFKQGTEAEKALSDKLTIARDGYEKDNNLNADGGEE